MNSIKYTINIKNLIWLLLSSCFLLGNVTMGQGVSVNLYNPYIKMSYKLRQNGGKTLPMVRDEISFPSYPSELVRQGIAGEVDFEFEIGEDGRIGKISVNKSSLPAFAKTVEKALAQWRFIPIKEQEKLGASFTRPVVVQGKFIFEPQLLE